MKITILFFDENKKCALICKSRWKEKAPAHMCWNKMVKLNGAWIIISLQRVAERGERDWFATLFSISCTILEWMVVFTPVTVRLCSRRIHCYLHTCATCTVHFENWSSSPLVTFSDQCSLRRTGKEVAPPHCSCEDTGLRSAELYS